MPVGSGARTAPTRLDAEEVVEQRDHVVVMEVAALVPHHERHDRQPVEIGVTENLDIGPAAPALDGATDERRLTAADLGGADRLLQLEHQARANRIHDGRRAPLFPVLDVGQVHVLCGVDVGDRPAAGHARHPVSKQLTPGRQHPWRARTADELVWRDEDGVQIRLARPS